jgi:hypothetical protein
MGTEIEAYARWTLLHGVLISNFMVQIVGSYPAGKNSQVS